MFSELKPLVILHGGVSLFSMSQKQVLYSSLSNSQGHNCAQHLLKSSQMPFDVDALKWFQEANMRSHVSLIKLKSEYQPRIGGNEKNSCRTQSGFMKSLENPSVQVLLGTCGYLCVCARVCV